jgi:hypothetical protein
MATLHPRRALEKVHTRARQKALELTLRARVLRPHCAGLAAAAGPVVGLAAAHLSGAQKHQAAFTASRVPALPDRG